jgi:hypothetical protein
MSNADDEQQHNSSQYSQHQDGARRIMVVPEESNTFDSGRLIGGQNHNLSGHAGWGIGTPTENVELGGQRNYQMVQQNNLRQQLAAFQLSLLGQRAPTSGPPQSQGATSLQHHGDILAAHANRQLPLNTLQYLGLQHLSSSLGLQSLAAQLQQLQGIPQGAQYQSMVVPHQVPNEYTANLQSSSLNDHLPVTQNQNAGEGASVVPCRARAMPQDHNAQVSKFTSSIRGGHRPGGEHETTTSTHP